MKYLENYKEQIYDELNREYAHIRENNKKKQSKMIATIYMKIPRIKEIDDEIGNIGLGVASDILNGNVSAKDAVEKMQTAMNSLTIEKTRLLLKAGFENDAMKDIYNCNMCKDKGYVDGKRCLCYSQKLNRLLQKYSNISMSDKNSFESFNINLYSQKPDNKYGISPRENMKSVYQISRSFAQCDDSAPRNLLFYGATGLGKTFTSDCIAKKYIENGKTVFYMSAPRMFSIFEDYKFGRDTSARTRRIIDSVNDAELLIIDDLGTEFKTAYSDSILFDVLNSRIIQDKRMIISTNLSIKDLKHIYSERIYSRILGNFEVVLFFGEDIRLKFNNYLT